jgi:fermentation-respiration switch protein FrsA (DUF1100 family)
VCGRSIGTTVAIEISRGLALAGIILITPVTSGKEQAKASGLGFLAPFAGDPFDNAAKCPRIIAPVLILHGTADETIPFAMGRKIFSMVQSAKMFAATGNGHHSDLKAVVPERYWKAIAACIR